LQKGDEFAVVRSVDLAVTLFTLGVPFYDPAVPYIYQVLGGKRQVRFVVEMRSSIAGVEPTGKLMAQWTNAELIGDPSEPMSLVQVCKRVIWERRYCLSEVNHHEFKDLQTIANGCYLTTDIKHAIIAYALGYQRPKMWFGLNADGDRAYVVGPQPQWLYVDGLKRGFTDLLAILGEDLAFVERKGNETNPIATALAIYINISAWLEHLRTDKPFLLFNTASGKSYWVKEGSSRWSELLQMGYSPS